MASKKEEVVDDDEDDEDDFSEEDVEIEAFARPTLIGPQPLNFHSIPRDQLIVEAVDQEHSDSDPFFQVKLYPSTSIFKGFFSINFTF